MDDDVVVRRAERGLISVLTMEYRPYNLLGPTLIGAIAAEVTAAQEAGSWCWAIFVAVSGLPMSYCTALRGWPVICSNPP